MKRRFSDVSTRDHIEEDLDICYGVARDLEGSATIVPILVKRRADSKVLLHGLDTKGALVGPFEDGKALLTAIGIQTWLHAGTLTPLQNKPTFWQRSLITAIREDNKESFRYSSYCPESYSGKAVQLDDRFKPSLKAARKLLKLHMKSRSEGLSNTAGAGAKRRRLASLYFPLATPEALNTLLVSEREYQAQETSCSAGLFSRGERANCDACGASLPDLHKSCGQEVCNSGRTVCMSCPDNACSSCKAPFNIYDYSKADGTNKHHGYAKKALHFCDTYLPKALESAEIDQRATHDAMQALPDECRQKGYYRVTEQQFKRSKMSQNASRQGLPVLVEEVSSHFDVSPFTVDALLDIGNQQNAMALYKGCDKLGIGDLVRPDGQKNLSSYLISGEDDPLCGTSIPDLGPKLYIARPRVRTENGRNEFHGETYTRLHCDLSDAVNYNYGEGEAIWTMFAADDRTKLQKYLGEKDLYFVSEGTFLTNDELAKLKIPYAQFTQKKGDLVFIPAGCPHQVENCSPLPTVKVAQDFIAAESVTRCWEMLSEMRAVKALDKLQLRLTLRFAAARCDDLLKGSKLKIMKKRPVQRRSEQSDQPDQEQSEQERSEWSDQEASEQPDQGPMRMLQLAATSRDPRSAHTSVENPGREVIAYTPQHQALASTDTGLVASTSLPFGFSDAMKSRSSRVEKAREEAADEVRAQQERKAVADARVQETERALADAIKSRREAQEAQKAAVEDLKKAVEAMEERDLEMSDLEKLIKSSRAEAKKFLELFP